MFLGWGKLGINNFYLLKNLQNTDVKVDKNINLFLNKVLETLLDKLIVLISIINSLSK